MAVISSTDSTTGDTVIGDHTGDIPAGPAGAHTPLQEGAASQVSDPAGTKKKAGTNSYSHKD
jgi:hypothetical protein